MLDLGMEISRDVMVRYGFFFFEFFFEFFFFSEFFSSFQNRYESGRRGW